MPGTSLTSASRSSSRTGLLAGVLAAALAVGGGACKQDIGERCQVDEDCADPDVNRCTAYDRNASSGGVCEPRSTGITDAGAPTDAAADTRAGADAGQTGKAGEVAEGGGQSGEAGGDSAVSADGVSEAPETSGAEAPAMEVSPDHATADMISDGG